MANIDSLLTSAEAGDRSVLPGLLNHCAPEMVARLRNRPHAGEAEDVVQIALARACQKLDGEPPFLYQGLDALRAWLWEFVEHAHADRCKYHRQAVRDERLLVEDGAGTSQDGILAEVAGREEAPSRQARRHERDERLRQAMRAVLTDEQQAAIQLRYFAGFLSVEEVAQRTGWAPSKVKMLCLRAIQRLREVLTDSMRPSAS